MSHLPLSLMNRLSKTESAVFKFWMLYSQRIFVYRLFRIKRISFYSNNLDLLPRKPKFSFRHLKQGIQEFHRNYILVPADKAANNVVLFDGFITVIL